MLYHHLYQIVLICASNRSVRLQELQCFVRIYPIHSNQNEISSRFSVPPTTRTMMHFTVQFNFLVGCHKPTTKAALVWLDLVVCLSCVFILCFVSLFYQ